MPIQITPGTAIVRFGGDIGGATAITENNINLVLIPLNQKHKPGDAHDENIEHLVHGYGDKVMLIFDSIKSVEVVEVWLNRVKERLIEKHKRQ